MSRRCSECSRCQGAVNFAYNDLGSLRGQLVRHGADWDVAGLVAKVEDAKIELASARVALEMHQAECELAQEREPRPIHVVAPYVPPKAKTKARSPKRGTIDREAVDAVLKSGPAPRGNNRLPVTGRCHSCDRVISGERRYCGPCLAGRSA